MKYFVIILVLFLLIANAESQTIVGTGQDTNRVALDSIKTDGWFSQDKGQHLIGSLIGTVLLSNINQRYFDMRKYQSRNVAVGIMISVGLTKETIDNTKPGNIFSWQDIIAGITGILAGVAIMEIK